jgi:hypothetical protein
VLYNNLMMKNFSWLLVMALLICCSYSVMNGFAIVGPFSKSTLQCMVNSVAGAHRYAITRVYQHSKAPAGIDPNAVQTILNANAAGFRIIYNYHSDGDDDDYIGNVIKKVQQFLYFIKYRTIEGG